MTISFRDAVFLYCLKQIKDERSISSLYHLFHGKKSSQTIQDAHLFKLTAFFHALPFLTRLDMENIVGELQNLGCLKQISNDVFCLTEKGERDLQEFQSKHSLPPKFLDGWNHQLTNLFWERLSILVQVSSNLVNKNKGFIPIQNKQDTQKWLKICLKMQNADRFELAQQLYSELIKCLEQDVSIEPEVLVLRLTGHKKIGLTSGQVAEKLRMNLIHYHIEFLNTLHYMISTISQNKNDYPLLSSLVQDIQKEVPFTLSTAKTFQLLKKGYLPEEIAAVRNLKISTIEDHIVEIALHIKEFELDRYVTPDKQRRIIETANMTSARKLKQIRVLVEDANYFEIRLVLARNRDGGY